MKKMKPERVFLILALMFGLIFVYVTPPFQSPDEDSHFKKAYLTSNGILYPTVKNKEIGNYFPLDMLKYIYEKQENMGNLSKKYTFKEFYEEQYSSMNYDKKKFNAYSTSGTLFFAYIPTSLGIIFSKVIAKVFAMNAISTVYMLYFARIFSLLMSIFIVYQAIKITPILKKTMVTIGLMPMSLYLMSMVTYDSIISSVTMLTVSYLLRLILDDKVEKLNIKHFLLLILLGFILFNYKVVYCVLFILLFFIPKEKFGALKQKIISFIILGFSILGLTIIFKIPYVILPSVDDPTAILVHKQVSFVLQHLLIYFKIVFKNIIDSRTFHITGMVGMFGLLDTNLPIPIVTMYILLLLFLSCTEGSEYKYKIPKLMKLAIIFAVSLGIMAIFTVMYISWTPKIMGEIGGRIITGVQGRYYIPFLFPLSIILYSQKINHKILNSIKEYYPLVIIVSLSISILTIVARFWI